MIDVKVDDGFRIMRAAKSLSIVGDFGFRSSCDIFNAFAIGICTFVLKVYSKLWEFGKQVNLMGSTKFSIRFSHNKKD